MTSDSSNKSLHQKKKDRSKAVTHEEIHKIPVVPALSFAQVNLCLQMGLIIDSDKYACHIVFLHHQRFFLKITQFVAVAHLAANKFC